MLTTTGLPAFCATFTACRIWSDAVTDPPGESTRSTMALMFLSRAAWPMAADRSSLAMPEEALSRNSWRCRRGSRPPPRPGRYWRCRTRCGVLHIVGDLDRLGAGAGAGERRRARFVVIADAVHQTARARIFGKLRAGFQRRDHFGAGEMAVGRHLADGGVIDRIHQRGELLAVGRRHLLFHEHVGGAFIFGALGDLRLGLDLVEQCRAGTTRRRRRPTPRRGFWAAPRSHRRRWRRDSRPGRRRRRRWPGR